MLSSVTKVKVKIFSAPSLALEIRELTMLLKKDATAADLLNSISIQDKNYLYVVRDGIRLDRSSKLNDGDEILLVPPIAGG
jgi:molybdopterin converting factor small subunit